MIILKRYNNQRVRFVNLDTDDVLEILTYDCDSVRLGITIPPQYAVVREELPSDVQETLIDRAFARLIGPAMAVRATTNNLRHFGKVVLEARTAAGLTAKELAERLGVSQSMVSRIESGGREPRLEIVHRVCKVLPQVIPQIAHYLERGSF